MRKQWVAGMALAVGVSGWTNLADAGLFSATRPVIAILGADLYVGAAEGHLSGSGTLAIHSQLDPGITCVGAFTSTALLGGAGQLRCNDGDSATFHFQRLSIFSGQGTGSYSGSPMSFTYGLTAAESEPYLKLPRGKSLRRNGEELHLIGP